MITEKRFTDSAASNLKKVRTTSFSFGIAVMCCIFGFAEKANAADLNDLAVSAELLFGKEDGSNVKTFYGTMTVPLFTNFGIHAEGAVDYADDNLSGLGIHAYWRNPKYGLLGLTASDSSADFAAADGFPELKNVKGTTTGVEAEAYIGPMTLALQVGNIKSDLEELDGENYTSADAQWSIGKKWYVIGGTRKLADNITNRVEAGYSFSRSLSSISLYGGVTRDQFDSEYIGITYTPFANSKSKFSFSAEIDKGEDDFDGIYLGAHYSFGPVENAPLIPIFDLASGGF